MLASVRQICLYLFLFFFFCTATVLQAERALSDVHSLERRAPQLQDNTAASRARKPDLGTKDAPVDGADGKPHAGPFVDPIDGSDKKATVKSSEKEKLKPEDGVMNDPSRTPPKKGTTGTEGGVSEKSKELEAHEAETGRKKVQKPEPPKDADAVTHKAGDEITAKGAETAKKQTGSGKSKDASSGATDNASKPKGAMSLEKPDDLPQKPHRNSVAANAGQKKASKGKNVVGLAKIDEDTDDDDDDDDDAEDGVHDLIRWDSLFGSFSSIAATEIGDKTFIVAALMAMRHPRLQVFTAAFSALFIMTILSGICGHAVGAVISKRWAALLAAVLFLVFGGKSLREGYEMDPDQGVSEEIQEVQAELEEKEVDMARMNGHRPISSLSPDVLESGRASRSRSRSRMAIPKRNPSSSRSPSPVKSGPPVARAIAGVKNLLSLLLSPAWVETFSMTFVGELGDRSQIATVAMAAGQEYLWVMIGASLGHFVCTAVAVIGGSVLAGRVSMRKVTLVGGFIFIGFGIFTLLEAIQYFR